jgi:FdhD protein
VWTLDGETEVRRRDSLVTEEPLEIRLSAGGRTQTVAVTMRTPGHDFELATGFLHAEGLLPGVAHQVSYCADVERADQKFNVVTVETDGPALEAPVRSGIVSSACGVCGSASLDALHERGLCRVADDVTIPLDVLYGLPDALRSAQGVFEVTGGLHAAGLFTADGSLMATREDVGRHNAVDKLVGWGVLGDRLPLSGTVLMVSGRCGYEIVQKAVAAGVCAVVTGRRGRRGLRRHAGRIPARPPLQRVRRPRAPPTPRPGGNLTRSRRRWGQPEGSRGADASGRELG